MPKKAEQKREHNVKHDSPDDSCGKPLKWKSGRNSRTAELMFLNTGQGEM